MTDLTDKWKKGELLEGWYYLKVNEELANHPVIAECVIDYALGLSSSYFYDFDEAKIEQVLAPVPSYEEVVKLKKDIYKAGREIDELTIENINLKQKLEKDKYE